MRQASDVTYKGHILTASAVFDDDLYAATLVVRDPNGVRCESGILGRFPSAQGAVRYALAHGRATIDYGQPASGCREPASEVR